MVRGRVPHLQRFWVFHLKPCLVLESVDDPLLRAVLPPHRPRGVLQGGAGQLIQVRRAVNVGDKNRLNNMYYITSQHNQ